MPVHFARVLQLAVALGLVCLGCIGCERPSAGDQRRPAPDVENQRVQLDVFAFGRVLGTIAPCGCTTEPLGGLPFVFGYLEAESSPEARLVVEPGSFLFPDPQGPEPPTGDAAWAQAGKRAELLTQRFSALSPRLASGLGPTDALSPAGRRALQAHGLPRVLANVGKPAPGKTAADPKPPTLPHTEPHRLLPLQLGDTTIQAGVTAVADPNLQRADAIGPLTDPQTAAAGEIEAMRKAGAELTVLIVHGRRPLAETLAREIDGLDLVVVGLVEGIDRQRLGAPAAKVGGTFVLEPGEQMQTLTHLQLSVAPDLKQLPPAAQWTVVPSRSARTAELARVNERLEQFKGDPEADPAFIERLKAERDRLRAALKGKTKPEGSVLATFEQAKITCHLPADAKAKKLVDAYDAWVARVNKKRFADVAPPEPPPGEPGYVGIEECDLCHGEAVEFWRGTVHAGAYETLEQDNKHYDLACVGCHVTGFKKPGGSHVVKNEGLTAVQCEVCHGPGRLHAEEPEVGGKPHAIERDSPVEVCLECHTPEHSDTFEYEPYLRDVLGPGHGEAARGALGPGPTGSELRAAGLAKAGGSCKKM